MKGLVLVLRAESYRLLRARSTWLGAFFLALVAALRVLAARAADAAVHTRALAAGRVEDVAGAGSAWAPFVEGWRAGLVAAALLLLIHAAGGLAADRESGVLRLGVTRASTRWAVLFGRAFLAPVFVLFALVATGISAFAMSAGFYEFGPLVEDGYQLMSSGELRTELILAVVSILPPLLALYVFGLFVSGISRSPAGAVGVALSLFLAFDLFKEVLGPSRYWVFASFVPSLVDSSAMQEMVGLAHGYSDAGFAPGLLRMSLVLPGPEALVLFLVAGWVLSRRSL